MAAQRLFGIVRTFLKARDELLAEAAALSDGDKSLDDEELCTRPAAYIWQEIGGEVNEQDLIEGDAVSDGQAQVRLRDSAISPGYVGFSEHSGIFLGRGDHRPLKECLCTN